MATFTQTVSGTNDLQGHSTSTFDGFAMGLEGVAPKFFGARFTNVTIPRGSTINSASVSVTSGGVASGVVGNVHGKISCEAADNPAAFGTGAGSRIFTATPTTAAINWNPAVWTNGILVTSPDIATAVQEVVNRTGFASGNSLVVLVRDNGSTSTAQVEGLDNTFAITIDYTEPVVPPSSSAQVFVRDLRRPGRRRFI